MFVAIILVLIGAVVAAVVVLFNEIVGKRNLMQEAWSGIDVQLKRRHDLVPGLLESVKGYVQYERNLLEEITGLRAKMFKTRTIGEKSGVENEISGFIRNVFAIGEAYPDLKANAGFLDFQKSLAGIEDQLQMARRYYNGTVRNYNTAIESFPGNLVAGMFNFHNAEFFEIEYATEMRVPDVIF
jgi:LemA protein